MKKAILKKIPIDFDENAKKSSFLNPYSYLLLRKQESIFSKIDVFYIDGISLVILLKIFGYRTKRRSFDMTSVAPIVFNDCIINNKSIYFIGSKQHEIVKSVRNFSANFPNLNIIGFRNGYFKPEEKDNVYNSIIHLNPDYLIAGLGTPIQEQFITEIVEKGFKGKCYTCGGFLHQTSDELDYYPTFFNKLNIRWAYRIFKEPKLIKRYFLEYPKSFFYIIYDFIKNKFN
jgi:exopolysaccharide biosynthesis WecB/TagA/CpsF family protein